MKLRNWDVELVKFCNAMRAQALDWSVSNCVLFAAGAVEVQTGQDLAADHRGKFHDEATAKAYMASKGWADVDDVADAFLPRVDVRTRQRGDILMFNGDFGKTLGVCLGKFSMVMAGTGAGQILSANAVACWRV